MFSQKKLILCIFSIFFLINLACTQQIQIQEGQNGGNGLKLIDENQIVEISSRMLSQDLNSTDKTDTDGDSLDDQLEPSDPNKIDDNSSKNDDSVDDVAITAAKADTKTDKAKEKSLVGDRTTSKKVTTAATDDADDSGAKVDTTDDDGDASAATKTKDVKTDSSDKDTTDDSDPDSTDDYDEYLAEPLFVVEKKKSGGASLFGFRGLMLLVLAAIVYCLARVFINVHYLGRKGRDAIPHREMIRESPRLLRDGVMYSKDVARETFSKINRSLNGRALSERGKGKLFGNGYVNV